MEEIIQPPTLQILLFATNHIKIFLLFGVILMYDFYFLNVSYQQWWYIYKNGKKNLKKAGQKYRTLAYPLRGIVSLGR